MTAELNKALAEAVAWWMERNSLNQATVYANGGPSSTTMTKIGRGSGGVRESVVHDLDAGLRWGAGTAAAYLRGEDPLGIHAGPGDSWAAAREWNERGGTDGSTPEASKKIEGIEMERARVAVEKLRALLRHRMQRQRLTLGETALRLGMSSDELVARLRGDADFTVREYLAACELLGLDAFSVNEALGVGEHPANGSAGGEGLGNGFGQGHI